MTDDEFDRHCKVLEKVDQTIGEALNTITVVKGLIFSPAQVAMAETILGDMFTVWHDMVLDQWALDIEKDKP